MHQKKLLLAVLVTLSLTGASCSLTQTYNANTVVHTNTSAQVVVKCPTETDSCHRYPGQTGKNALDLLKSTHTVDVSTAGFVNAIDGVKPGDHQYWSFYVNGKQAEVGAKDYQTKNTDTIEWKLEAF